MKNIGSGFFLFPNHIPPVLLAIKKRDDQMAVPFFKAQCADLICGQASCVTYAHHR